MTDLAPHVNRPGVVVLQNANTEAEQLDAFDQIINGDTWHNRLWNVLVEEAGAHDSIADRYQFAYHFPKCREFRFSGKLGFGGKVRMNGNRGNKPYIDCYRAR